MSITVGPVKPECSRRVRDVCECGMGAEVQAETIIEKGSDAVLCQKSWLKNGKEQLLCPDSE